jgi:plastocyanin
MRFLTILVAVAAAVSRVGATTIRIEVGQTGLTFSPNNITAAVGDILEYHFHPPNHSVVMSDFNNPCQPASSGGFYSGFMPVSSGESVSLILAMTIFYI